MDGICKINLKYIISKYRSSINTTEAAKKLNGIEKDIFRYDIIEGLVYPAVGVYISKKWWGKLKSIFDWNLSKGRFIFFYDEVEFLTFIYIWNMKRKGTWKAYIE